MNTKILLSVLSFLSLACQAICSATFDGSWFGEQLDGWHDHEGKAARYVMGGTHHFRTWRPDITQTADDEIRVSAKLDHDRKWRSDDHAVIIMVFNAERKLVSIKTSMLIQGKGDIDSEAVSVIAGSVEGPETAAIAKAVGHLYNGLKNFNQKGGRLIFPAVVEHNADLIVQAVRRIPPELTPDQAAAFVTLYQHDTFRGAAVTFKFEEKSENFHYIKGENFDNKASSIKWNIPSGYKVVVYGDRAYQGGTVELSGRGQYKNLKTELGKGDQASSLKWLRSSEDSK